MFDRSRALHLAHRANTWRFVAAIVLGGLGMVIGLQGTPAVLPVGVGAAAVIARIWWRQHRRLRAAQGRLAAAGTAVVLPAVSIVIDRPRRWSRRRIATIWAIDDQGEPLRACEPVVFPKEIAVGADASVTTTGDTFSVQVGAVASPVPDPERELRGAVRRARRHAHLLGAALAAVVLAGSTLAWAGWTAGEPSGALVGLFGAIVALIAIEGGVLLSERIRPDRAVAAMLDPVEGSLLRGHATTALGTPSVRESAG